MIGKIIQWVYNTYLRPRLLSYVRSTSNSWDDTALQFLDEVVALIATRISTYNDLKSEFNKTVALAHTSNEKQA